MEKEKILATLEDYAKAYCDKDIEALMNVFADGDQHGAVLDNKCKSNTPLYKLWEAKAERSNSTILENEKFFSS